jgi:protein involved in polysaccharide export with SLBB domain
MVRILILLLAVQMVGLFGQEKGRTAGSAAPVASMGSGYTLDDKHKLKPGDKVSFRIEEDREEPKKLTVADSGELEIPYIGRITVGNKTCKQVAEESRVLLEREYYYRASVVVAVDSTVKVTSQVYVMGQVKKQGSVDIPADGKFTLARAIMLAGGFSDFAQKREVRVTRTVSGDKVEEKIVDLVEVVEKGKVEKDLVLLPDDLIFVPKRLINF